MKREVDQQEGEKEAGKVPLERGSLTSSSWVAREAVIKWRKNGGFCVHVEDAFLLVPGKKGNSSEGE